MSGIMHRMDGILPVYKPVGISSFDVIRAFKRAIHPTFKLGHAGTLDPFADGVMILMLGRGTKQFDELQKAPKTYLATAVLGASSDTLDLTGVISHSDHIPPLTLSQLSAATAQFKGVIEQAIPDYSAAKVDGVPRYLHARRGETLPPKTKPVTIYSLDIESLHEQTCTLRVSCSSGTYIRQLSYDLFHSFGIESYLQTLTRESVGHFRIEDCCQIADFTGSTWQDKVAPLAQQPHDGLGT
jgi:tRNA pseudouridine55 synthase